MPEEWRAPAPGADRITTAMSTRSSHADGVAGRRGGSPPVGGIDGGRRNGSIRLANAIAHSRHSSTSSSPGYLSAIAAQYSRTRRTSTQEASSARSASPRRRSIGSRSACASASLRRCSRSSAALAASSGPLSCRRPGLRSPRARGRACRRDAMTAGPTIGLAGRSPWCMGPVLPGVGSRQ